MIQITYSTTTYNFRNPEFANMLEVTQKTLFGRTASGVSYRYAKGVAIKKMVFKWENLIEEEKVQLITIFGTITTNQFTLRDHREVTWTAVFLLETLKFEEISDEINSSENFYLGGKLVPSSTRQRARYNVEIEMEVW